MATYVVTKVSMEWSDEGGRHEHIEGVCTAVGTPYTRRQVVESIRAGYIWDTQGPDGSRARIHPIATCKHLGCSATPYITTNPDSTGKNNLDNLPRC